MSKAKMIGMNKPFIPNSKADRKRNKPFMGVQKKENEEKLKQLLKEVVIERLLQL